MIAAIKSRTDTTIEPCQDFRQNRRPCHRSNHIEPSKAVLTFWHFAGKAYSPFLLRFRQDIHPKSLAFFDDLVRVKTFGNANQHTRRLQTYTAKGACGNADTLSVVGGRNNCDPAGPLCQCRPKYL